MDQCLCIHCTANTFEWFLELYTMYTVSIQCVNRRSRGTVVEYLLRNVDNNQLRWVVIMMATNHKENDEKK